MRNEEISRHKASRKKREQVDRGKGGRIIGDCCAEGKRGDIEKRNTGSQAAELVKSRKKRGGLTGKEKPV